MMISSIWVADMWTSLLAWKYWVIIWEVLTNLTSKDKTRAKVPEVLQSAGIS